MRFDAMLILSVACFGIVLSSFVLFLLLKIKHKDFTVILKNELIFYDLFQQISAILCIFYDDKTSDSKMTRNQAVFLAHFFYLRFIHSVLIFYIGWVLFRAITKKDLVSDKELSYFTVISNLLAGIFSGSYCLAALKSTDYIQVFYIFYYDCLDLPPIIVGLILICFYYKIRKTLKKE
jgi:hypothetical protein